MSLGEAVLSQQVIKKESRVRYVLFVLVVFFKVFISCDCNTLKTSELCAAGSFDHFSLFLVGLGHSSFGLVCISGSAYFSAYF